MTPVRAARAALVVVFLCAIALAAAGAPSLHPYRMATGSMEPTLLPGDYFLVRPLGNAAIARGEIVQMRYPLDSRQIWIKRVVAVGGDRLRFRDKTLILNGSPVTEPYAFHTTAYLDPFRDNFPAAPIAGLQGNWRAALPRYVTNGELVVPEGKFFVLGDNRDNSLDSRYFGFVERSCITGKPVLIYYSAEPAHAAAVRWQRMFRRF